MNEKTLNSQIMKANDMNVNYLPRNKVQTTNVQTTPLQVQLTHGFLLTRNVQDIGDQLKITLWVKTLTGPVKLDIFNEKAVFFIRSEQTSQAERLLNQSNISYVNITPLGLKTFAQVPVSACYFNTLRDFYRARDALKFSGVICYEDDFRPDDRYLMERFITADLYFTGTEAQPRQIFSPTQYRSFTQVKCKTFPDYHSNPIALSMVSLDIECSMQGELYSIGLYSESQCEESNTKKEHSCVYMIGDPNCLLNTKEIPDYIHWVKDEVALLNALITWINENDPDIMIGWNVVNFDFSLLQKRCDLHGIPFAINRDDRSPYWRENKTSDIKYLDIAGRVVLDGIDLLKTATYNFPSFSLDNVANTLLGKGKIIDDVENRGEEITQKFLHDKVSLAVYNLEDCKLVWEIFEHTQLLDFAKLRGQLTGLNLDRMGGSVAAFTNLYLPKLHRSGYVAPNMGDGVSGLISPGGFVMDSLPGLYKNVLVLDFKSLYPSIIRTFNIDPMGLIEGLQAAKKSKLPETFDTEIAKSGVNEPIKGFDDAYFSRTEHFLPDIIQHLWEARDQAKAERNSALSQAIKIIMNSFYGVLGSTGCRFFDPRLSGSITKRSHELLKQTKAWIEAIGYKVIYGDTDSIFVHVGEDKSLTQSREIGIELQDFINTKMTKALADKHNVTSALEIEFETHFSTFLMPTIRGLDIGTKKRYAGMILHENNPSSEKKGSSCQNTEQNSERDIKQNTTQEMVYKGLETVRTDWTELAKMFQQTLYLKVFNSEPVNDYIKDTVAKTLAGEFDDLLVYRKRIRRNLSDYVKNVPPHVKAARAADAINEAQGKPLRYQRRGWIEYYITLNGPQTKAHLSSPLDYQFYIDRQLAAVADGILPFIGTSFTDITDNQLSLFN